MQEWDIYLTSEVRAWLNALQGSDRKTADLVDDAIYVLSCSGPALGRPLVDTIAGSTIRNMKETQARIQRRIRDPHPVRVRPVEVGDPADRREQGRQVDSVVRRGDTAGRAAL